MWFLASPVHIFTSLLAQAFTCNDPHSPTTNSTHVSPRLHTVIAGNNCGPYPASPNKILKEARETQGEYDSGGRRLGSYERRRILIHFLVN